MVYVYQAGGSSPRIPYDFVPFYIKDNVALIVKGATTAAQGSDLSSGPAVGANFTLETDQIDDGCARILTVTNTNAGGGGNRGPIIRIRGINQFGMNVEETLTFAAHAGGAATYMHTLNAYTAIDSVNFVGMTGTAGVDTLKVGIVTLAATLPTGTLDTANGAAAGRYKGIGLPVPLSPADGTNLVAAASFPTQLQGVSHALDVAIPSMLGPVLIVRTTPFLIDTTYQVYVPQEATDTITHATGAAKTCGFSLQLYSNNRRNDLLSPSAPGIPPIPVGGT